jgi:Protease inhibitor Inh
MTVRYIASCAALLLLAGCAGEQFAMTSSPPPPKIAMSGRWILRAPNAPSCGMNFERSSGAEQGAIHPEGGCPGKFFMSRYWQLDHGRLAIDDYQENPLATLKLAHGSFQGKSIAGTPVTLTR